MEGGRAGRREKKITASQPPSRTSQLCCQSLSISLRDTLPTDLSALDVEYTECRPILLVVWSLQGDSGGPLVCHNGREWIQVGVASFTSASRPGSVPGVFTRVSSYVPWIRAVIAEDLAASQAQTTTCTPAATPSTWSLRGLMRLFSSSNSS